ncbi:hypothetical protein [Uliginosibacterium gangwonense]|uniref:hypothetical protein n=1 Tax=Uliginosibacterium gangwonense TaxID=392736 RepID=UPI000362DC9E|nr:hypothetical protein [Uliginosibacterium gangwonense]
MALNRVLIEQFIAKFEQVPEELILGVDASDGLMICFGKRTPISASGHCWVRDLPTDAEAICDF